MSLISDYIIPVVVLLLGALGLRHLLFGPKQPPVTDLRLEELKMIREQTKALKTESIKAIDDYRAKKAEYEKIRNSDSNPDDNK